MKKIYYIAPLILAAAFLVFYLGVQAEVKAKEQVKAQQDAEALKARETAAREVRERTYKDTLESTNKRIAEREAKKKIDDEQAARIQELKDARDLTYRERNRQEKHAAQLADDLRQEKELLSKIQESIKLQQLQVDYLKASAKDVTSTKAAFEQTLAKIEAVDKAAEAAARAAASAKKS